MTDKIGSLIIIIAVMIGGYWFLNNWAIEEYGVVRVWAFKRVLFSPIVLICIAVAVLGLYISTKLSSPKMLIASIGIAVAVPFGIWLYHYLGSGYFNVLGKGFFYSATTGGTLWLLSVILFGPIGIIKRFMQFGREAHAKIAMYESKAVAILADSKGRYRQSQYITASGKSIVAIDTETGQQKWYLAPTKAELAAEEDGNPWAGMDATQIFEQIYQATARKQNCPSLIIAGKKRSGKSYFASWLTREYADEIDFVVYDPKQYDPLVEWGATTRVVGNDGDYEAIARDLKQQEESFKSLYPGHPGKKRILLFDEWLSLVGIKTGKKPLHEHGEYIFNTVNKILTEMSYLGVGVIVMPHATSCTALRLPPGYGELKNNYDGIFRFHGNLLTGDRKSYFEVDQEEYEIRLWNPDTARRGVGVSSQKNSQNMASDAYARQFDSSTVPPLEHTGAPIVEPERQPVKPRTVRFYEGSQAKFEKAVCEAADNGALSKSQICAEVGKPNNGKWMKVVGDILYKHRIELGG